MAKGLARLAKPTLWFNGQQMPIKEGADDAQVFQEVQMSLMYEVQAVQVRAALWLAGTAGRGGGGGVQSTKAQGVPC